MLQPDQQLGPYKLVARIGAGGMGEVWRGEDTRLGRSVAIKVLPAAVASDGEAIARMKREARTAAQLYHPNIATIHSIEQEGDLIYIVMEFVEGDPLTKLIRDGLGEADVCRIGRGVADALAEAHEHNIVHRDIKPDNIIVKGNRVKVLDFGIAKSVGADPTTSESPTAFVTQQGMIIGTVHYMSPEQALGKALDARTDIFSLGVVLYEAATGRLPFKGETLTETITQIIRDEPEQAALVNPTVSPGLNAIIVRCLQKKREDRYASAAELSAALDQQLAVAKTSPYTKASDAPTVMKAAPSLTGDLTPTVQKTAAATPPTVLEAAATAVRTPPTVVAPPPPAVVAAAPKKKSPWIPVAIVCLLLALVAAAAVVALRQKTNSVVATTSTDTAATSTTTTSTSSQQPAQPSTASVSVTAPPSVIEETTSTKSTTATTASATPVQSEASANRETTEVGRYEPPPDRGAPPPDRAGLPPDRGGPPPDRGGRDVGRLEPPPQPSPPGEGEDAPLTAEERRQSPDQAFEKAMAQIGNNEWREARKTLHRVLMKDPHYAKAHFRLAQIALLNRNMGFAQGEYELALADASRLGPREEKLTRIGLAIATNDRETARTTARGMRADFPNDPDLERIVRTFPGMFGGGVGGGRGDGQRRFPGRP